MENKFFHKISLQPENEGTKIILALFAGIAAGSILTALLVSDKKFNIIGRLISSSKKDEGNNNLASTESNLPHPERYLDAGDDIIIQPT